ncbi:hypothetical protein B0O99DRAFT_590540 [Bisporella sp. PMI_857]|nr:hypothetical protein B0O99DRAFT_590540 [Bisporella sp. PMI_857]
MFHSFGSVLLPLKTAAVREAQPIDIGGYTPTGGPKSKPRTSAVGASPTWSYADASDLVSSTNWLQLPPLELNLWCLNGGNFTPTKHSTFLPHILRGISNPPSILLKTEPLSCARSAGIFQSSIFNMEWYSHGYTSSDSGSLTVMNNNILTEIYSPNTAEYKRKQFWNFRWEVQRSSTLSERAQQEISSRLTTLRHMTKFDASAIRETRTPASKAIEATAQMTRWNYSGIPSA